MRIKERCEDCAYFLMTDRDNYIKCTQAPTLNGYSKIYRPRYCGLFKKKFSLSSSALKTLAQRYGFKVAKSKAECEQLERKGYHRVQFDFYDLGEGND